MQPRPSQGHVPQGRHAWPHPPGCSAVLAVVQTPGATCPLLATPRVLTPEPCSEGLGRGQGGGQAQAAPGAQGFGGPQGKRDGESRGQGGRAGSLGGPDLCFGRGALSCGGKRTDGDSEALSVHLEAKQTQLAACPSLGSPCLLRSSTHGGPFLPRPPDSTALPPLGRGLVARSKAVLPCSLLSFPAGLGRAGPHCRGPAAVPEPQYLNPQNGDGFCAWVTTSQGLRASGRTTPSTARPHGVAGEAGCVFFALASCPSLPGASRARQVRPRRGLGVGGSVRRTALTVEIEDRGFVQLEPPDVLAVFLQPRGVPELSPGWNHRDREGGPPEPRGPVASRGAPSSRCLAGCWGLSRGRPLTSESRSTLGSVGTAPPPRVSPPGGPPFALQPATCTPSWLTSLPLGSGGAPSLGSPSPASGLRDDVCPPPHRLAKPTLGTLPVTPSSPRGTSAFWRLM